LSGSPVYCLWQAIWYDWHSNEVSRESILGLLGWGAWSYLAGEFIIRAMRRIKSWWRGRTDANAPASA